jgi:predicted DNA-binding transcriptional regulator YafY
MPSPLAERLSRLAALHNLLAAAFAQGLPGRETDEILDAMGCERKALYRHAQDLRELGAPIEYDDGFRLWRYTLSWNPPSPWTWSVDGALALRLSMDFLLDPQLEYDLKDVVAVPAELHGRVANQTLPRLTAKFSRSILPHLSMAIRERRVLRFEYRKPNGETSLREVCPHSVFEWNGMPYLQATERTKESKGVTNPVGGEAASIKRFAFSRISSPTALDDTFRPPARKKLPTCLGAFCAEVFTAELVADPSQASYVMEREWHPEQTTKPMRDGSVVFTLPFGDTDEAARWIVGQGPGIKPAAPKVLVGAWRKMVRQLALQAGV